MKIKVLLITLGLTVSQAAFADNPDPGKAYSGPIYYHCFSGIKQHWFGESNRDRADYGDFEINKKNRKGIVEYDLDKDGFVITMRVIETNPNPQVMAGLFDLVASSAPVSGTLGTLMTIQERYDLIKNDSSPLRKALLLNSGQANRSVLLRAIPTIVLKRYPSALSKSEIHSVSNYRGIPIEMVTVEGISKLRKPWVDFFKTHKTATRQDLLALSEQIDLQYKSIFVLLEKAGEPIR